MPDAFPLVSCLCLTYARPAHLREAIWCFLQQDWPNKELVIVNDHPEPLYLDRSYPGVRLYNLPHRFASLGAKRNFSLKVARGDYLLTWDDDDLVLPWRISLTMRHLLAAPGKWVFRPTRAWVSHSNRDYEVKRYESHPSTAYLRAAFDAAGGYTEMNTGEDADLDARIPPDRWIHYPAPVHELYYVYRWAIPVHHISGLGFDRPGNPTAWERIAQLTAGRPGGGIITPGFDRNYWQDLAVAAPTVPGVDPEEARLLAVQLKPYTRLGPDGFPAGGALP
ncbi:MAG TPA: glycosyltransferase family A protein [Symbiobacteriaceae bacterium]|nr:glycosyltransferase family A protein [Symbiobacteriaceae bacterium]